MHWCTEAVNPSTYHTLGAAEPASRACSRHAHVHQPVLPALSPGLPGSSMELRPLRASSLENSDSKLPSARAERARPAPSRACRVTQSDTVGRHRVRERAGELPELAHRRGIYAAHRASFDSPGFSSGSARARTLHRRADVAFSAGTERVLCLDGIEDGQTRRDRRLLCILTRTRLPNRRVWPSFAGELELMRK